MMRFTILYNYGKDAEEIGKWNSFQVEAKDIVEALQIALDLHNVPRSMIVKIERWK